MSILIHKWHPLGPTPPTPDTPSSYEPRVQVRCGRCKREMSVRESDYETLCPEEEVAVRLFSEPELCEPNEPKE